MKYTVKINSFGDVNEFVHLMNGEKKVTAHSLDNQYVIDAKSIMGLFSLNLDNNFIIDNPEPSNEFENKIKKFIVR